MGNILTTGKLTLAEEFEKQTYGGNEMWADPEEARQVGGRILDQLCERYGFEDERDHSPSIPKAASKISADVLKSINYAALPTERRVNILHGLVDAAAEAGVLGGESEWAQVKSPSEV